MHRYHRACSIGLLLLLPAHLLSQAHSAPSVAPAGAKSYICKNRPIPQLIDVTAKAGIAFTHASAPEKKYIVVSQRRRLHLYRYEETAHVEGRHDYGAEYRPGRNSRNRLCISSMLIASHDRRCEPV